jgi:hypothetical protein
MALATLGQLYRHHRGHRIERAARLRVPELVADIVGVAVFVGFVMDADLPFFAACKE